MRPMDNNVTLRRAVMSLKLSERICSSSPERMSSRRSKWPRAISRAPAVSSLRGLVMRVARATAMRHPASADAPIRPRQQLKP